jgi:hypothetical protein
MRASVNKRSPLASFPSWLLERGRNRCESRVQLRSETLHDRDDRNRNAGGDQAVFDGCCGRFVVEEGRHEILHYKLHLARMGTVNAI